MPAESFVFDSDLALMLFSRASRGVELSLFRLGRLVIPALAWLYGGADSFKIRLDLIKAQVVGRAGNEGLRRPDHKAIAGCGRSAD